MRSPAFGNPETFADEYPQVASIAITVRRGMLGDPNGPPEFFTELNAPSRIECQGDCGGDGGFDLQPVYRRAIAERATTHEETVGCEGYRRMGRGEAQRCYGRAAVALKIVYR